MPPKRRSKPKKAASKPSADQAPPPSSEDAKPSLEQLNADLEAAADEPPEAQEAEDESLSRPMPTPDDTAVEVPHGLPDPPPRPLDQTTPAAPAANPATGGRKLFAQPRFPGRRTKAKREELQKAEEERRRADAAVRAAEEAKARRGQGRHHGGRRGRGRGGYMGEGDRGQTADRSQQDPVPSGPFSAGEKHKNARLIKRPPPSSGWTGLSVDASPREGGRPSSRRSWSHAAKPSKTADGKAVKVEAGSSTHLPPVIDKDGDILMQAIDGGYISSDEDDTIPGMERMNVEDFGTIDLTQEDSERDLYAPIRVLRVQHKQRALSINAEGVTDQEGAITVDANDIAALTSATEKRRGKSRATRDVEVTGEKQVFHAVYSDSEDDRPHIKPDPEPVEAKPSSLPEQPPSSPETRRKGKERIKARPVSPQPVPAGPTYHTREDFDEWERQQDDLRILRGELGNVSTGNGQTSDKRADKVYLFQFPPILPDLLPIQTKDDPVTADSEDAMQVDRPNNIANKPIKVEDDSAEGPSIPSHPALPSGAVGKLNVHASGRVTLDWGGTRMCLGMGAKANFLQDVLLATLPEQKPDASDGMTNVGGVGTAVSMGQVKGKFVVTPDWDELMK